MRTPRLIVCLILGAGLASCGSPAANAQNQADGVTKAVYNDDGAAVTQNFDSALQKQVTRAQVGLLSDKLHKLGDYKGLTYVSNDGLKNEYTYRANFSNGTAPVIVRFDSDGKVAAYRITLPQ
ncbi:MAG TPA: hypothetical protein VFW34_01240 [Candidatus Rubrimentiphilum sp.]|nr:hypothetical protein [Candidatus Rubrimentiphilum sp.]